MKNLLIGITGNSGCGQTEAAGFSRNSGVSGVCSLDEIGHRLLERSYVQTALAMALYQPDLKYIPAVELRASLSHIAFKDPNTLMEINRIIHPRMKRWASISASALRASGGIWVLEGALLCELGINHLLDVLIVIRDTKERAVARAAVRDNTSVEIVHARWRNQMALEAKIELSDFVIDNDSDLHSLQVKTSVIFEKLISY